MLTLFKLITRSRNRPHDPALAMLGVKPGDRVVVLGAGRPALAAAVAAVTGLNGQTTVVDRAPDAKTHAERAAADAGALIDFVEAPPTLVPLDAKAFDSAVVPSGIAPLGADAALVLAEAIRLVRPGGRVLVCEPLARQGLFKLAQTTAVTDPPTVVARLTAAGLRAARHVGSLDGVAFLEAAKAREA